MELIVVLLATIGGGAILFVVGLYLANLYENASKAREAAERERLSCLKGKKR